MYLAYFDESGDAGIDNSPTRFFVLAALIVHETHGAASLDQLIALRRGVKAKTGISTRPEIKATDIRRAQGPLQGLGWSLHTRMRFYRDLLDSVRGRLRHAHVFAVAIDKVPCHAKARDPRATAWEFALQRLDRFSRATSDHIMVFPDEGHGPLITRLMRRMRRFERVPKKFGTGSFSIPTQRIVEDPNERRSDDSYFIQVADWMAYAVHKSSHVDPHPKVDPTLWDVLAPRHLTAVNRLNGGPPGIVRWP